MNLNNFFLKNKDIIKYITGIGIVLLIILLLNGVAKTYNQGNKLRKENTELKQKINKLQLSYQDSLKSFEKERTKLYSRIEKIKIKQVLIRDTIIIVENKHYEDSIKLDSLNQFKVLAVNLGVDSIKVTPNSEALIDSLDVKKINKTFLDKTLFQQKSVFLNKALNYSDSLNNLNSSIITSQSKSLVFKDSLYLSEKEKYTSEVLYSNSIEKDLKKAKTIRVLENIVYPSLSAIFGGGVGYVIGKFSK